LSHQFSANQVSFAPDDLVLSLLLSKAQNKNDRCFEIRCGANPHTAIGNFFDQAVLRWRIRLANDLAEVPCGVAWAAAQIKGGRRSAIDSTKRAHAPLYPLAIGPPLIRRPKFPFHFKQICPRRRGLLKAWRPFNRVDCDYELAKKSNASHCIMGLDGDRREDL
jgi:hypothetical protein